MRWGVNCFDAVLPRFTLNDSVSSVVCDSWVSFGHDALHFALRRHCEQTKDSWQGWNLPPPAVPFWLTVLNLDNPCSIYHSADNLSAVYLQGRVFTSGHIQVSILIFYVLITSCLIY